MLARSSVASLLGGMTFAIGWWILIDGYAYGQFSNSPGASETQGYGWLPPFGAVSSAASACGGTPSQPVESRQTLAFVMMNGMRWSELRDDNSLGDPKTAAKAKLFLISSLFVAFGSVVGAAVLMVRATPGSAGATALVLAMP